MSIPYNHTNHFNEFMTSDSIANQYNIDIKSFIDMLIQMKLVYRFKNHLRLTQKGIKFGGSYKINLTKKTIIWAKDVFSNILKSTPKSKLKDILDNLGVEYIYHMTHISNLNSILKYGLFSHSNSYKKYDISDNEVNDRRSRREPLYGKPIHEYVPFYFNPKNAMLYRRKNIQNDIVILKVKRDLIVQKDSLFTDGNAASNGTKFLKDIAKLDSLAWDCINDTNWCSHVDGRRTRMAEVLVPNFVSVANIEQIVCSNRYTKSQVDTITQEPSFCIVNNKFYF